MYKRKRTGTIIAVFIGLLVVLGAVIMIKTVYTVKTVYVEGNVHYTEEEIKAIVMEGPLGLGDNSLYLSMKYKKKGVKNIPFVDVMDVSVLSPDTIKITVYEKVLTGYVKYLDTCMYFDKDGCVVENSTVRTVGVPQITGLHFDHIVLDQPLPVEDYDIFEKILNVTKLLQKYNLSADRLHFNKSGEVTVYFGEIKVALGSDNVHLEDKIMILPELLPNLSGKKGMLHMTSYDENSGKYIFKPE